jgi:hypothetical protein
LPIWAEHPLLNWVPRAKPEVSNSPGLYQWRGEGAVAKHVTWWQSHRCPQFPVVD